MVNNLWEFRGVINITNPSSTEGVQSKVVLTWASGMSSDFSDIRFTTTAGVDIPHWRETYTAGSSATFWLKLPASLSQVYIYYGNPEAATASAGPSTFELFGPDTGKWTTGYMVFENNGPYAALNTGYNAPSTEGSNMQFTGTRSATDTATEDGVSGTGQWGRSIRSVDAIPLTNFIIEARINFTQTSSGDYANIFNSAALGVAQDKDNYLYGMLNNEGTIEFQREAGGTVADYAATSATYSAGVYRRYKFIFISENECTYSVDGTSGVRGLWIPLSNKYVLLGFTHRAPSASVTQIVEWVFVRKHVTTEPSLAQGSAAENPDFNGRVSVQTTIKTAAAIGLKGFLTVPISLKTTPALSKYLQRISAGTTTGAHAAVPAVHDIKIKLSTVLKAQAGQQVKDFYPAASGLRAGAGLSIRDHLRYSTTVALAQTCLDKKIETSTGWPSGEVEVSKTITDAVWEMTAEFTGPEAPPVFFPLHHEALDHLGVTRHLFTGISPCMEKVVGSAGLKTRTTAYDYAWYLSAQYIPDDARTMEVSTAYWGWSPYRDWDEWIKYLVEDTGIVAYKIGYGPSVDWKQLIFTNKTTKREAIDEICKYCDYIFEVKWRDYGTPENPDWKAVAYWVPQDKIDDPVEGLDLPDPITLTWPDPYLVDLPRITMSPEENVNRVRIIGSDAEGNFFSATMETAAVTAGTELPREYLEESGNLMRQTHVNTYAASMLTYFARPAVTVSMRFIQRFDLELYQKIKFGEGFPPELYELTDGRDGINYLRIVGIKYHTGPANNYVDVTAVYDHPITIVKGRQHALKPNWVTEMEDAVNKKINAQLKAVVGTIDSVDSSGNTAVMVTEFGSRISVRIK